MYNKLSLYLSRNYLIIVPMIATFVVALLIPPFSLFSDRIAGLLQTHLLLELFSVIVAVMIAIIAWHDLSKNKNTQSGIVLLGFTIIAILDLVHALTYAGMPKLIIENTTHRAIFFWLAGRAFVALTLLLLLARFNFNISRWIWLASALFISTLTIAIGTYWLDDIPNTFIPGIGVTNFKRNFEYILFLSYIILFLLFIYRTTSRNQEQYFQIATSCIVMAMGEIIFSSYTAPSDFLNMFGHLFKIISYTFLYQSVFLFSIRKPYQQAKESEARFRSLTELSSDWYWEQDEQFRFTMMSQGMEKTHISSIIGKSRWELPIQGVSAQQWEDHRNALNLHEPFKELTYKIVNEQGELRTFSISGFPIYNDDGIFIGYRGIGTDITEQLATQEKIENLAYYDNLTNLPNRQLMQDRFALATAQASRTNKDIALLYLDLDNFKSINDTLGHDVGDELLKKVALRLKECVRDTDTISRQGGDEFLILISDVNRSDDVVPILEKIVEQLQISFLISGSELSTSISVGAAIYPHDGKDFETLRKNADMAMYEAKSAGRNTYRFFDEKMNVEVTENLFIRNGLKLALIRKEFVLHYQPQIDLATGNTIGVEALIRWNHPQLGTIYPGRFITIAEESGLIIPIGTWVLNEACNQAMAWQREGLPSMVVAVNLSAVQFKRGDVHQSVKDALQNSGLDSALLELELTESIMIQNADLVLSKVQKLKQLGIKLSIDDFGTGYSSLSYLKRFAIDKLKIDQSFIRDLATDINDAAIVRAIIQMARSLNLKTIAEGVETEEMQQKLIEFQCNEVQGYYYARPMPAADISAFITNRNKI